MSVPRWRSKVKNTDDSVKLDELETKAQIEAAAIVAIFLVWWMLRMFVL